MSLVEDLAGQDDRESSDRQSFVLRVWIEEASREGRRAAWRGRIIHIQSSDECYTGDLNRIRDFIARRLDRMGARLPLPRKIALWLSRRRHARHAKRRLA